MFEWDEKKSQRNREERGLGFDVPERLFFNRFIEWVDDRKDYGETRMIVVGAVEGRVLTVVYTWRGDRRRVISLRIANRMERDAYRQKIDG
jgi:hypothetical protein